ncbi:unnamed protein product [Ilex paraguariensis]|uniref:Uncharacterized protein n=1 Tax=Ilex paraguariensis TaxID=185542 RepID=A0ABC8TDT9_9AQUA
MCVVLPTSQTHSFIEKTNLNAEWCFGFQSVAVITNCRVVFNEIGPDGAAATADEDDRLFPKCLRTTRSPVGKFPDVPFGGGPRMYIQFFWVRGYTSLYFIFLS